MNNVSPSLFHDYVLFHIENYYILAHNLCYGTNIKHGVIFMVSRDLQYQQFVLEPKDTERYETQWLERLGKYYDKHGLPPELSQQQN